MNFAISAWNQNDYEDLLTHLHSLADEKYQAFNQKLIPNENRIIGIRMPELQKLAKQIANGNWQEYLSLTQDRFHEEILLKGLVIGNIKTDLTTRLKLIADFVPLISNWAVCDSFCGGLKFTKEHRDEVLAFLMPYFHSEKEYDIRFAVVMLLNYYIHESTIDTVLSITDEIQHEGYYVKMAVAWCISLCFVSFEEKTKKYLSHCKLDDFTYNKAVQKIIESNQISKEKKAEMKLCKRKTK
jgi:3-methyladenine DNA glycosylase AlkD